MDGVGRPELFFGIVGAAGADLKSVKDALARALRGVGYSTKDIRVSQLIASMSGLTENEVPTLRFEECRIEALMNAGDRIRERMGQGDAVVWLALPWIRQMRSELSGSEDRPSDAVAFVIDSLKHPSEINTLRKVYGDSFFVISAYSPRSIRITNLTRRIAKSHNSLKDGDFSAIAERLIDIDEQRQGTKLGQNVRDTFPLADLFVSIDERLEACLERFINLLFGYPFTTPTPDEYWMFNARAAALRSADLSRQVGAVITTPQHEFCAAGCNEVPIAGGGAYWEGMPESKDDRDFRHGRDANAVIRYDIVSEFIQGLRGAGLLSENANKISDEILSDELLFGRYRSLLKDARVRNLIEFGRIVHAEMSAITEAARRGVSIKNGVLYCTTFPCHMCARHVISSGIKRVVYTEPYPKSMTRDLYRHSVVVDGDGCVSDDTVVFEPFRGVAPQLFFKLFTSPERKDERGYSIAWNGFAALPRTAGPHVRYLEIERAYSTYVSKIPFRDLASEKSSEK